MKEIAAKFVEWLLDHDYNEACETDDICKRKYARSVDVAKTK